MTREKAFITELMEKATRTEVIQNWSRVRGCDISSPLDPFKHDRCFDPNPAKWPTWYDDQALMFYQDTLRMNWNYDSGSPSGGYQRMFMRAARAGELFKYGFKPRYPEEIEATKRLLAKREEEEQRAAEQDLLERKAWKKKCMEAKQILAGSTAIRGYMELQGCYEQNGKLNVGRAVAFLEMLEKEGVTRDKLEDFCKDHNMRYGFL